MAFSIRSLTIGFTSLNASPLLYHSLFYLSRGLDKLCGWVYTVLVKLSRQADKDPRPMTITDAIRSIHRTHAATRLQEAEIGLVRFRLNQAEAESHALETALTMWEVLFS